MVDRDGRDATTGGDRLGIELGPLDVPKASDVLANELRERILSGELPEGMALPPERDLVDQTKLSRATVREALRVLEVQGMLSIRAGRSGGAFVHRPDGSSVASSVDLVIRGQQIRLSALHETRAAIEPSCAALAAERRTDEDLARLEAANQDILEAGDDLPAFLDANVRWHIAVAEASHNELLSGFMSALSRAIYSATENEQFVDREVRETAHRAHDRVLAGIRDRDPDAARRRMARHVHGFAAAVLQVDTRDEIPIPIDGQPA